MVQGSYFPLLPITGDMEIEHGAAADHEYSLKLKTEERPELTYFTIVLMLFEDAIELVRMIAS